MSLLSAHGLSKSFGSHQVLVDVTLTLTAEDRVGLVGDNGSGKSTLARIMAGEQPPDTGELMLRRGARVGYLPQVPQLAPGRSARATVSAALGEWHDKKQAYDRVSELLAHAGAAEQVERWLAEQAALGAEIERLGGWDVSHKVEALCERLGVAHLEQNVELLSGGEQRRVALAGLLLSNPDLLILDEPTNHLDTESIDWLERYFAEEFSGALLIVTHDRYFLDRLVTRTAELAAGKLTVYEGGWESYLLAKAEREEFARRTEDNRQNFLRKELEWLRRQPKARGTKQKARIDRAQVALDTNAPAQQRSAQLGVLGARQGSNVLELEHMGLSVPDRTLVEDLSFIMTRGQRVGILGRNGAGKSTLLRAITGERAPDKGRVKLGQNSRISYFDQARSSLDLAQTVRHNVAGLQDRLRWGDQELTIYSYLGRFMFYRDDLDKQVGMLSGGERARVVLAKLLLQPSNLLVLDEPTNDLDVSTLGVLEEMLVDFAGSALVVTHDRYFLNRVVTDLLVFEDDAKVTHYVGNYDNYLSLRPQPRRRAAAAAPSTAAAPAAVSASAAPAPAQPALKKGRAGLSFKEQRELEGMLEKISAAEERVTELERELSDPEFYKSRANEAPARRAELAVAQASLEQLMARWEELESKRG
jgi:ATP-binding cassette subfamily F protein uup